jgi:FkbM family methyltransferase
MYSQNEEERFILEAVGPEPGVLLDIGAYDGKERSNSLALIELGWCGVLVEPSPIPFAHLVRLHGSNPRLKLVNALVGTVGGIVPLWTTEDSLTTTEIGNYERWKDAAKFYPLSYAAEITITDLLIAFPELKKVKFISIDTEGTSYKLFSASLFLEPKVFCVEIDGDWNKMAELAAWCKYDVTYRSAENLVLVRR